MGNDGFPKRNLFLESKKMNQTATKTRPITVLPFIALANLLVNRFNGLTSIFEPKGDKLGMRFATISFRKPMKMRKNHRTAKTADGKKVKNPFLENGVFEVGKIRIDVNAIWENAVNNKVGRLNDGEKGDFEADKKRSNGILNYLDSRVVCHKIKEQIQTFYLNYIVADYIGETKYEDADGNPLDYADLAEYHQVKSQASKQREADKHGLEVEKDVQIRQMKFENITTLSIFGVDYVPQDTAVVKVDTVTPQSITA
jgi:hypothetical protein